MVLKKINWCAYTESVYYTTIFIIINTIVVLAFIKPELFDFNVKYGRSKLYDGEVIKYSSEISSILKEDHLYKNPELTVKDLSHILKINPRHVSQIINVAFNKSFIELINEYRINDSIDQLTKNPQGNISIKEICYSSGFNSRSAFNNAFKKQTGFSPSEYREKNTR
jgi:AraC-like DNA-binding protein